VPKSIFLAGASGDVLLLSGGVSAGKLDLVPATLEAAGVRQVFHTVNVKPGKPVWFGVLDVHCRTDYQSVLQSQAPESDDRHPRYVFGLPGNPVSSMVCFELFARTAIRRLMGVEPAEPQPVRARLVCEHTARGARPPYHPARLEWTERGPVVAPVAWHGSSDLRATVAANAMALFPAGDFVWSLGNVVEVFPWDGIGGTCAEGHPGGGELGMRGQSE
jgi:molybdopterin molybdotransferase